MGKRYLSFIGILVLIGFVVGISGCTSSGSSSDPNKDLYITNPMTEQTKIDANGNTVGFGEVGDWHTYVYIRSKTGTVYNDIKANITAFDKNNQQIFTKVYTINYLPKNGEKSVDFLTKTEPDHYSITIVNATP